MARVKGRTCYAYFRGDGLGNCDTGCQWYQKSYPCVMWIQERLKDVNLCDICKRQVGCKIEPDRSIFDDHAIACFDFEER